MAKEQKPLSNEEASAFFQQMSMILQSGISPYEGIVIMYEDSTTKQAQDLLMPIKTSLEEGNSLYISLKESHIFSDYALEMVHIGEYTGNLEVVTKELSQFYEEEESTAREIRSAVSYPIVMIGIMICVVCILVIKVLPVFNQVYLQLGSEMTGLSRSLLHLGEGLSNYGLILGGIIVLAMITYGVLLHHGKIQPPWPKSLQEDVALARFASGLSLVISSGLDTDQSLQMLLPLISCPSIHQRIATCQDMTQRGVEFTEALQNAKIFSGLYTRMISIGFKTGCSDTVMKKIAGEYHRQVRSRTAHLVSLIEPTLVAILSLLVGIILLSVMLPLLGILTGMSL